MNPEPIYMETRYLTPPVSDVAHVADAVKYAVEAVKFCCEHVRRVGVDPSTHVIELHPVTPHNQILIKSRYEQT